MANTFLLLGSIVFLAYLFRAVFDRTRVPDVLLLMGLGLLLGPAMGWVQADDFGKVGPVLATLALIVILLESGTSLHLNMLQRSLQSTLVLTLLSFFVTMGVVAAAGYWLLDAHRYGQLALSQMSWQMAQSLGVAIMAPEGLAAAVLAGVPLQYGIEAGQLMQDFTFVVVFVSICLTAFLLPLTTRVKADHSPRFSSDPP